VARAVAALLGRISPTTGRLAGDALRANPRRTTLTVMSLLLPVSIVIIAAMPFDAALVKFDRLARTAVATPLAVDADSFVGPVATQPLAPAQGSVLEAVPGVRAVLPYENANISLPDGSLGLLYAVPLATAERAGVPDMVEFPRLASDPAAFTETLTAGQIAASHFAARRLDLRPGSRLTLPTPSGPHVFTVGAFFDDWSFTGSFAVDIDTYRAIWRDDGAARFAIVPTEGTPVDDLRGLLEEAVAGAAMPALVRTLDEASFSHEASTHVVVRLIRGITLACFVFAGLALATAAFTAVTERRWTFALQRTLGMTKRQIARSLALEAAAVGAIGAISGAIVGLVLGVLSARIVARGLATTLPSVVPWTLVVIATVLGIVVALSATDYPRRVAKRLTIIEALRFE
jgi:hypothetical protein